MRFTWDHRKAESNIEKHDVSFDEANTTFNDPAAIRVFDPDLSEDEDRFILLGMSYRLRLLVVCHCYRENDQKTRIISQEKQPEKSPQHIMGGIMREEYDFTNGVANPYIKPQKTTVTIRLDKTTVDYFKELSAEINMPYQTIINSYLSDCAEKKKKPVMNWE